MDVRIAYGIDLNSVPDKIIDMLGRVDVSDAAALVDLATDLLNTSNPEMADALIDQARIKLATLDRVLNDCQLILKGYLGALQPQEPSESEPVVSPTQETPNAD